MFLAVKKVSKSISFPETARHNYLLKSLSYVVGCKTKVHKALTDDIDSTYFSMRAGVDEGHADKSDD